MGATQPGRPKAVFLDRDGVINRNVFNAASGEFEAPLTANDFVLLPGAREGLQRLHQAGFLLILVSNQPNYAKRKSSLAELHAVDEELRHELSAMRVEFAAAYYCFHHPEGDVAGYSGPCACRKPSPYFPLRACREFGLDVRQSWMVGDRATDILCGHAAGVRTILIDANGVGYGQVVPDRTAVNLAAAATIICGASAESPGFDCLSELQVESLRVGRYRNGQAVADCRSF
jgi:D-glycero-D-manno-heptose 1,7-bisphosphate phosphatase